MDVIIPALNCEETVADIVEVFTFTGHRVIVVDDCSADTTAKVAADAGAQVITGPGIGKGQAVASAMEYVTSDRVVLMDADLKGVTADHAALLTQPHSGMNIGAIKCMWMLSPSKCMVIQAGWWLSGQRSMPTWFARFLAPHLFGYSMETQLNNAAIGVGLPIKHFDLMGVWDTGRDFSYDRHVNAVQSAAVWTVHDLIKLMPALRREKKRASL